MEPITIAALGQAATGAFQFVKGLFQGSKANKMARNNKRPDYSIADPILDNQNLIESRAGRGISGEAVDLYNRNSDRQQTAAIDAILKSGGGPNSIADLYAKVNDGTANLALMDDAMRVRNFDALTKQNTILAGEMDKEWQIDVWGPYADKAQAAMALKKQSSDNISKGINTVGSAATTFLTGGQYGQEGQDVYGRSTPAPLRSSYVEEIETVRANRTPIPAVITPRAQPTATEIVRNRYPGFTW